VKASADWSWAELKHRLVLTSEEKRVIIFVIAVFLLGVGTKCYRDARPKTPVKSEKRAIFRHAYHGAPGKRE
jgi:hypothetical protein